MVLARLYMEVFSEGLILLAATSFSPSLTFSMAACARERRPKMQ